MIYLALWYNVNASKLPKMVWNFIVLKYVHFEHNCVDLTFNLIGSKMYGQKSQDPKYFWYKKIFIIWKIDDSKIRTNLSGFFKVLPVGFSWHLGDDALYVWGLGLEYDAFLMTLKCYNSLTGRNPNCSVA